MMPGAFTALACSSSAEHCHDWRFGPDALTLPPAVLVHLGHGWMSDPSAQPVAVAVPRRSAEGTVIVDGVLASTAVDEWWQITSGRWPGVSVCVLITDYTLTSERGLVATEATLFAVDLVRQPADTSAWVIEIRHSLTPREQRTQHRFDAYLADPTSPLGIDFSAALGTNPSIAVLDPLRAVVAGTEWTGGQGRDARRDSTAALSR